ncbi:MAG: MBL fold metallo-hydrolase [Thermostichales cyanobacterium HHBFW_bins_127]
MRCTWLDSNSWLIELGSRTLLIDPWLVGSLRFGDLPWLFEATRPRQLPWPPRLDVLLLSQGLPDHAHLPTLRALAERFPQVLVLASPRAARVARQAGLTQVIPLAPGQVWSQDGLQVEALVGAPVGPVQRENAYLVRDPQGSFYYEPHGYPSSELASRDPVQVVITPVVDLQLPLVGAIIRGRESIAQVARWLQPQLILPTAMAGEVIYSGLLAQGLRVEGSVEEARQKTGIPVLPCQVGVARECGSPAAAY